MRDNLRGYAMIGGAAFFWGISATAAKFLFNHEVSTLLVVQTRVTFSALLMAVGFGVVRPSLLRVNPRDLWRLAVLGIVGVAGANITYYLVIRETTVATAIIIQYTAPLLVLAYGVLSHDEGITPAKLAATLLSIAGCALAVGAVDGAVLRLTPTALAAGIGSIVTFAFLTVYTRKVVARMPSWTAVLYALVFASLMWAVVNPPWEIMRQHYPVELWPALVGFAVISILVPHSLFAAGLRSVVPSRAIITSTLEPVVAIASAAVALGELLTPLQVVGACTVLGAIVILNLRPEEKPPGPPAPSQRTRHASHTPAH
jgi:drug/metabolite transporter (DMT)-like permease